MLAGKSCSEDFFSSRTGSTDELPYGRKPRQKKTVTSSDVAALTDWHRLRIQIGSGSAWVRIDVVESINLSHTH